MATVRPPAVAGLFYPGDAGELDGAVAGYLERARSLVGDQPVPKAVIVPHAGYVYSGSTAALAYAIVERSRGTIERVVLLGPCHRVPIDGLAASSASFWRTPLGEVSLERPGRVAHVLTDDLAHASEHSLEVQVPFLQRVLDDWTLVPLAVGRASGEMVADAIDSLWGGAETLFVISTDLSHYLPYRDAQRVDAETIADVLALRQVTHQQACGATPLDGMLVAAHRRGMKPHLLGACNSGDTAGDKARVVGYAAFLVAEA